MGDLGRTWFGFVDPESLRPIEGELAVYDNECTRMVQTALELDRFREAVELAKCKYGKSRVAFIEDDHRNSNVARDQAPLHEYTRNGSLDAIMQYGAHATSSDIRTGSVSRLEEVRAVEGVHVSGANGPGIFEKYLTPPALVRLGGA